MRTELEAVVLAVVVLGRKTRQLRYFRVNESRIMNCSRITWRERRSWDEMEEDISLGAEVTITVSRASK
jgi:hypothetical protein